MAEIVRMPRELRIASRSDPFLEQFTRTGGVAINGHEQVVSPLTERWRWQFSVAVLDARSVRVFRAFVSRLRGRGNYAEVRVCDQYRLTRKSIGLAYPRPSVPHAPIDDGGGGGGGGGSEAWGDAWGDAWGVSWGVGSTPVPTPESTGAYFSDGSGYALAQPTVHLTSPADLNDTEISFDGRSLAGMMDVGLFVSIGGWFHLIEGWSQNGTIITAQINPPMRRARPIGYDVEFDAKFVGRLETDMTGQINDLQGGKYGLVTISLFEDIGRAD